MGSEDFHRDGVPLMDRSAGREAATEIAHIFNESSLRDRVPLTVDFGDLNRNMYQDAPVHPSFDHMQIGIAIFFGHYASSTVPLCSGTRSANENVHMDLQLGGLFSTPLLCRSIKRILCRRGSREFQVDYKAVELADFFSARFRNRYKLVRPIPSI